MGYPGKVLLGADAIRAGVNVDAVPLGELPEDLLPKLFPWTHDLALAAKPVMVM
jgi:hypothetical protein